MRRPRGAARPGPRLRLDGRRRARTTRSPRPRGAPRWLQLYVLNDRQRTLDHVAEAREAGYSALVLTVDSPYLGRRERDLRLGFEVPRRRCRSRTSPASIGERGDDARAAVRAMTPSVTWRDLEWIAAESQLPVVLKGVAHARGRAARGRARRGRRSSSRTTAAGSSTASPATLDALPEVVEAVAGRVRGLRRRRHPARHRRR